MSAAAGVPAIPMDAAAVDARSLSVGYGGETVVADIDLRLDRGKVLALVGSNGSGKTTLLKTIAGLLPPVSGKIAVLGGAPLAKPGQVAYMGQFHPSSFMLPLRAIDVVRMARFAAHGLLGRMTPRDERAVREALERMGVAHLAQEPLNTLSGGQRQKVFLAQAFAREADLILLDEPAANLDAPARDNYRRLVRELANAGRSVIVATHDIDEAADYDWTMLLAHRVVAYGHVEDILTPEALLSTFGIAGSYKEGRVIIVGREHGHEECGEEQEIPVSGLFHQPPHDHAHHRS
jgi:ABC-type Mn2+/Zn2+ transport system ATPase subunit